MCAASRRARRGAAQAARAALDPDNASILVAGGGGVALEITRRLKDMGAWVWQLQRSDSRRRAAPHLPALLFERLSEGGMRRMRRPGRPERGSGLVVITIGVQMHGLWCSELMQ